MNENIKEYIKEYVLELPPEMQEVVNSFEWVSISDKIGEKVNLNKSELLDLQIEIALVLVNMAEISDFARNVENNIGMSKKTAEQMANEVLEKIFKEVSTRVVKNIKSGTNENKVTWGQNINFIMSGGNYFTFLDKLPKVEVNTTETLKKIEVKNVTDLKDKFTI